MLVMDARIVLLRTLVKETLQTLISVHQGASKMSQRARLSLYWPYMTLPTQLLPSLPAEALQAHAPATQPFEFLHADLSEDDGRHFLVIIDQFSGWSRVTMFQNKNSTAGRLLEAFQTLFVATGGAPVKLWTDNVPFQAAEFQAFLRDWDVSWASSSPHYPQSNGRAQVGIKSMKKLVIGCKTGGRPDANKLAKSFLLFRNAPRMGGASPAQLVINRPVRDSLPAHRRSFAPEWQKLVIGCKTGGRHDANKPNPSYYSSTPRARNNAQIHQEANFTPAISTCFSFTHFFPFFSYTFETHFIFPKRPALQSHWDEKKGHVLTSPPATLVVNSETLSIAANDKRVTNLQASGSRPRSSSETVLK